MCAPKESPDPFCYASVETPRKRDVVAYAEKWQQPIPSHRERSETWIVTSVIDDMVRAKCEGAEQWRQAHYVKDLRLIRRHNGSS